MTIKDKQITVGMLSFIVMNSAFICFIVLWFKANGIAALVLGIVAFMFGLYIFD